MTLTAWRARRRRCTPAAALEAQRQPTLKCCLTHKLLYGQFPSHLEVALPQRHPDTACRQCRQALPVRRHFARHARRRPRADPPQAQRPPHAAQRLPEQGLVRCGALCWVGIGGGAEAARVADAARRTLSRERPRRRAATHGWPCRKVCW